MSNEELYVCKRVFFDRVCYDVVPSYDTEGITTVLNWLAKDEHFSEDNTKCKEVEIVRYNDWNIDTYGMPYEVDLHLANGPVLSVQEYFFHDFDAAKEYYDKLTKSYGYIDWLIIEGNSPFNEEMARREKLKGSTYYVVCTDSGDVVGCFRTSYDAFNTILDKMHDPAYIYKVSSESIKGYYHYQADDKR